MSHFSRALPQTPIPVCLTRHPLRLLLATCLLLLLAACASMRPQPDRIKVTMVDVRPLESTLMEQRYLIKLRVQNRSQQALTIDGVSFDLELNGRAFASGVSNQTLTAPGFGEGLVEVKVSSTLFGVIRQFQTLQSRETKPFEYRISGSLHSPDSLFSLPFDEQGEIDLGLPAGADSKSKSQ
jgi:LEA14-like dessication related protein